jgi:hypothetical protein
MADETFIPFRLPLTVDETRKMMEESLRLEAQSPIFICPTCDCCWPKDLYPDKKCPACPMDSGYRERVAFHLRQVVSAPIPNQQ